MQEIERNNLKSGKLYYIECLTYDYSYEFPDRPKIIEKSYPKVIATFIKLAETEHTTNGYKLAFFKNFRNIKEKLSSGYDVQLSDLWRFYEVKKYQIQEKMEARACNLIISKIINDDFFKIEVLS